MPRLPKRAEQPAQLPVRSQARGSARLAPARSAACTQRVSRWAPFFVRLADAARIAHPPCLCCISFCKSCIDDWLQRKKTCPCDRSALKKPVPNLALRGALDGLRLRAVAAAARGLRRRGCRLVRVEREHAGLRGRRLRDV